MGNVAIVTDSTACVPRELVEQYGIGAGSPASTIALKSILAISRR